ncbi:hypothetical protein GQ600_14676 [Phytophthora cactorum]|nr:hypothetical protein GQ600_14676 [Phytophthora cactorum]
MAPSAGEAVTAAVDVRSVGELQSQLRAMSYSEVCRLFYLPFYPPPTLLTILPPLLQPFGWRARARETAEKKMEKVQRDALELSQILLPLRKENAQLTKENNSLHLEIIHQEEAITEREKACELQLEGLRDDVKKLHSSTLKSPAVHQEREEVAKLQAQLERVLATGGAGPGFGPASIEMRGSDMSQSLRRLSIDSQQARKAQQPEQQAQVARDLQDQLRELTRENEKLRAQCGQFDEKLAKREKEIDRLSKLSVQVVNDKESSSRKLQDLEERYQTRSKQEATELQVEQLSTQVDILNDQVAKYESRLKEASEQIRRNGGIAEKLQQAELDREHFVKELNVLRAKYHVLEEEHLRCGDSNHDPVAPGPHKAEDVEDHTTDATSLKEQVQTLTTHKDRLEDALRAMHYDKISYTNALSNANSHNRVLTSDLARAEAKLKELNVEKAKLEQSLADARSSLDAHTRELDVLRESLKQSEDNRARDNEKNASLHRELRSMDQLLSQRDEECRSLNRALLAQKGEVDKAVFTQEMKWLEEERHDLRMNLEEDLQKAKGSLEEAEHEKERLLEKINVASKMQTSLESMLETKKRECADVQRQLVESKDKVRELTDKQNQAQNEALALKRHVEELRDQNASLKNRTEAAVATKNCSTLEKEKAELQNNYDSAWSKHKQHSLSSGQNALQSSQSSVSDLRNQVRQLQSELKLKQNNAHQLETRLEQEKTSHKSVQTQLVLLQDELLRVKETNRALDRLEHLKGMHTAELAALAQDLENMTVENQAISEECTRLQRMEHSHSQSTKSMKQTTREIERERDTLQIELEDLRHTYRSLIQEHEGMQKARTEISALQEELAVVNESLRKQVATLDNQLQMLREKNATLTTESAPIETNEEKQEDLQSRMQQLVQELDAQKQVSTEISAQRYGAQAENAAVSQRIVHLEAKLSNCKYEMKSLQDKLHAEQSQRRSMEEKIANSENLISHLEEQRNAMAQEIQASHQRQVPVSTPVMNMAELNHSPPSLGQASRAASHVRREHVSPPHSPSVSPPSNATGSTPESGGKASSTSSFLPLHALEEAHMKCQELEDRLAQQDDTIKGSGYVQQLERSRSKFKRFAAKYEREIEQF